MKRSDNCMHARATTHLSLIPKISCCDSSSSSVLCSLSIYLYDQVYKYFFLLVKLRIENPKIKAAIFIDDWCVIDWLQWRIDARIVAHPSPQVRRMSISLLLKTTFLYTPISRMGNMRSLHLLLCLLCLPFMLPHQLPCSSFQHIDENFLRANQAKLLLDPRAFFAVDMVNDCNMHYLDFATLGPPMNKDYGKYCAFIPTSIIMPASHHTHSHPF